MLDRLKRALNRRWAKPEKASSTPEPLEGAFASIVDRSLDQRLCQRLSSRELLSAYESSVHALRSGKLGLCATTEPGRKTERHAFVTLVK